MQDEHYLDLKVNESNTGGGRGGKHLLHRRAEIPSFQQNIAIVLIPVRLRDVRV